MDYSIEAHDRYAKALRDHLSEADGEDREESDHAFYVQMFVVAKDGEPVSVWRWNADIQTYSETTRRKVVGNAEVEHELTHASPNLVRGRCGVVAPVVESDRPCAEWASGYEGRPKCTTCEGTNR